MLSREMMCPAPFSPLTGFFTRLSKSKHHCSVMQSVHAFCHHLLTLWIGGRSWHLYGTFCRDFCSMYQAALITAHRCLTVFVTNISSNDVARVRFCSYFFGPFSSCRSEIDIIVQSAHAQSWLHGSHMFSHRQMPDSVADVARDPGLSAVQEHQFESSTARPSSITMFWGIAPRWFCPVSSPKTSWVSGASGQAKHVEAILQVSLKTH